MRAATSTQNFRAILELYSKYSQIEPGLLAYLLDIERPEQVSRDPLMGSIFENLVVVEALKARYNRGLTANLYFYRDSHGNEIDLLPAPRTGPRSRGGACIGA